RSGTIRSPARRSHRSRPRSPRVRAQDTTPPSRASPTSSSRPLSPLLFGVELDLELAELLHVARRRRRQRRRPLDRSYRRGVIGGIARAPLDLDAAHVALGSDLEGNRHHETGPRDHVRPARLHRVDDLLAVRHELEADELATTARTLPSRSDRT